jgi:hypothetical protein
MKTDETWDSSKEPVVMLKGICMLVDYSVEKHWGDKNFKITKFWSKYGKNMKFEDSFIDRM